MLSCPVSLKRLVLLLFYFQFITLRLVKYSGILSKFRHMYNVFVNMYSPCACIIHNYLDTDNMYRYV